MAQYCSKTGKIAIMMSMTLSFFLVEIIVGHIANSLALIADSFHMLSDVVALIVGLVSVRFARRGSSKNNTFGWARAEVVGALVNAVFLVALCFTILVEAIERLVTREPIEDPYLLLYVGGAGLIINLIGLFLFHDHAHGHTHGGTSSHSHHGHSHSKKNKVIDEECLQSECVKFEVTDEPSHSSDESGSQNITISPDGPEDNIKNKQENSAHAHQLNMRGVFLHVLGDALGSVVVMISAGLTIIAREFMNHCHEQQKHQFNLHTMNNHSHYHVLVNNTKHITPPGCTYTDPDWVQCVDPVLSMVLVVIILSTSIPLLKQTGLILMQTVPTHITVSYIQEELEKMDGVLSVHEFHVWRLAGNKIIASVHVVMRSFDDYIKISGDIKELFHLEGIHSVTIQPEFHYHQTPKFDRECSLECGPDRHCHEDTCCSKSNIKQRKGSAVNSAANNNPAV